MLRLKKKRWDWRTVDRITFKTHRYKLRRDKLKIDLWGSKMIKISTFWVIKKTDGSWFFRSDFDDFVSKSDLYGFIEKRPPQKALCLGPDPPPGARSKFIDFWPFFMILGSSIEPEKPSVKSASTPYPP
jgi:hypothetical protein